MKTLAIFAVFIIALGASYLVMTGLTWVLFWALDALNIYHLQGSIWVAGLLFFVVGFIVKSILPSKK